MRVLITTDTVGGVWTFTQELCEGLIEAGCSVCLVSMGRAPSAAQQAWASAMHGRFDSSFLFAPLDTPLEWMADNSRAFEAASPVLLELVEVFAPEILHSSQFCFGALAADLPILVTAHSDVLGWSRACHHVLEESAWLRCYMQLVERGLAGAAAVTVPTQWMFNSLAEGFTLPERAEVIANGRRLTAPARRIRRLQAVTAGRLWDEAKNIALLHDVVSPISLLLAGDSQPSAGAPRSAMLSSLGVLAEAELLRVFTESAIYICPSVYEPFGLAPLEAALCGCAVLANDIASLREVWADGAAYFSNAASLSALLERLSSDGTELKHLQARSHARASLYTRERMVTSYLALYRDLVASSDTEEADAA